MGIHGLAKLIADNAPSAIKEQDIKNYFGKNFFFLSSVVNKIFNLNYIIFYFYIWNMTMGMFLQDLQD